MLRWRHLHAKSASDVMCMRTATYLEGWQGCREGWAGSGFDPCRIGTLLQDFAPVSSSVPEAWANRPPTKLQQPLPQRWRRLTTSCYIFLQRSSASVASSLRASLQLHGSASRQAYASSAIAFPRTHGASNC